VSFWGKILSGMNPARWFSPKITYLGGNGLPDGARHLLNVDFDSLTVAELWASQPHLRTVVSFRARNVAQIGLHVFQRVSDTDRQRHHDNPLAQALRSPDLEYTTYDMLFALVGDLDLHDRAYWLYFVDTDGRPRLRRIPPLWVTKEMKSPWETDHYLVSMDNRTMKVPPEQMIEFSGYHTNSPSGVSPTVDALKETLREQVESAKYRNQVWKRGGRVSSVIERPKDAPQWTEDQANRFREDWYATFTGKGSGAGGTPILEDGMKLNRIDFSAREQQYVEAAKLSLSTVASAFHVNPTMVGQMDGANYSNVREFRRMLYGDSLGPTLKQIEYVVNQFVIPRMGMDPDLYYAEFNIGQKLNGSFEEQAAVMQTLVGAPIMTRNEGRGRFNLPDVEGGDELIVPLNVVEGGQASPTDSGSQNWTGQSSADLDPWHGVPMRSIPVVLKSDTQEIRLKRPEPTTEEQDAFGEVFQEFFARQRRAVMSRIFAKSESWWDDDRWNEELSELILTASTPVVWAAAGEALEAIGVSREEFDMNRTTAFRRKVAERIASQVNDTTLEQIVDALGGGSDGDDDESPQDAVGHVFDVAEESRGALAGVTAVATFAGFAVAEAARQTRPRARKKWIVTSSDPRASHAAMDGEEVGMDETFSNGLEFPGSYSGDAEEVANCRCEIAIVV